MIRRRTFINDYQLLERLYVPEGVCIYLNNKLNPHNFILKILGHLNNLTASPYIFGNGNYAYGGNTFLVGNDWMYHHYDETYDRATFNDASFDSNGFTSDSSRRSTIELDVKTTNEISTLTIGLGQRGHIITNSLYGGKFLFASEDDLSPYGPVGEQFKGYFYFLKTYDTDNLRAFLRADLRAAKRLSDGKIGILDILDNTFYLNILQNNYEFREQE